MIDGTTLREVRRRRDWTQAHLATVVDIPASVLSAYERCRREPSLHAASRTIRVLCPGDLAVFKAMFDRPKDWVDIATMVDANALDVELAAERLARVLGTDDARVDRLRHLAQR